MKTYHYDSGQWHANAIPLWARLLRWLVWLGGWEDINHNRDGYRVRLRPRRWRPGARGWRGVYDSMTPIALFGHRFVFQWYGARIATRRGYWCVNWPSGDSDRWRVYYSPDSTPRSATLWLVGAPTEVRQAATTTGRLAEERERRRERVA